MTSALQMDRKFAANNLKNIQANFSWKEPMRTLDVICAANLEVVASEDRTYKFGFQASLNQVSNEIHCNMEYLDGPQDNIEIWYSLELKLEFLTKLLSAIDLGRYCSSCHGFFPEELQFLPISKLKQQDPLTNTCLDFSKPFSFGYHRLVNAIDSSDHGNHQIDSRLMLVIKENPSFPE